MPPAVPDPPDPDGDLEGALGRTQVLMDHLKATLIAMQEDFARHDAPDLGSRLYALELIVDLIRTHQAQALEALAASLQLRARRGAW